MNVNSNKYTFAFALIMVVIVAALLSTTSIVLREKQEMNVLQEKMQDILKTIRIDVTRAEAPDAYKEYISEELIIRDGAVVDSDRAAFDIDMKEAVAKPLNEREVPLYIASVDGSTYYIVPLYGNGLWGPIWGYVSLEGDGSTILGANFGHKGETPGLGAEISTEPFYGQYAGKQIMDDSEFKSVQVRKGDARGDHQVNGISGGTITSVGVEEMMKNCLQAYTEYFKSMNSATAQSNTSSL